MAVTIRDVAALAMVSPSIVSRVCKDHPSISKETKEKVRRAMTQLGYECSVQPGESDCKISRTIGVV
jgi:DNA-binding LacI/PurR family transcriptional regulator